jgi:hypothetical protein
MTWTEECQNEIDRLLAQQNPKEVLSVCISELIEAKIGVALYNCGVGCVPGFDPMQAVDFNERLLAAVLDSFVTRDATNNQA